MAPSPFFLRVFLLLFFSIDRFSVSFSSEIMFLPLTHSLSTSSHQFNTTNHLLKSTSARSAARFRRHRHRHRQISLPLSAGSDYTLSFTVGSDPSQAVSLYMDTGSDLVWLPCSPFQCILCEGKSSEGAAIAAANISSATAVPCESPACAAAHSPQSTSDLCAIARCPLESIETSDCAAFSCPNFYYAYGDGSLIARLYRDTFAVRTSPPSLILDNFTFGCSHSAFGEPVGVAGFGRGVLSLPAQLASLSPQLGGRFSYCLVSHSFDSSRVRRPSPLIIGRSSVQDEGEGEEEVSPPSRSAFVYAPMLSNPKHPYFYSVALEAISVGSVRIRAPESLKRVNSDGDGGMVVDSGTTFTMLPTKFFKAFVTELDRRLGSVYKRASETEARTGLGPCYHLDSDLGKAVGVPKVAFHLGKNSSMVLPRRNYFYEFLDGGGGGDDDDDGMKKSKVGCLMVMDGGDESEPESSGPAATLGNYQQQGFEVVYDLEKRRVGFARRKCASLWESLNGH